MRITLESDYALRIISILATATEKTDANTIAEKTSVSLRFALKILHKLTVGEMVESFKGKNGGYILKRRPESISLKDVIELIDGPIAIARCLESSETCSMISDKTACIYHHIFDKISLELSAKLNSITIADVLSKNYKI